MQVALGTPFIVSGSADNGCAGPVAIIIDDVNPLLTVLGGRGIDARGAGPVVVLLGARDGGILKRLFDGLFGCSASAPRSRSSSSACSTRRSRSASSSPSAPRPSASLSTGIFGGGDADADATPSPTPPATGDGRAGDAASHPRVAVGGGFG